MHSQTGPWLVLVGPAGTGKSTLGRLVAERVGRAFVDLDAVAEGYYREVGWSIARLREHVGVVGRRAAEAAGNPWSPTTPAP